MSRLLKSRYRKLPSSWKRLAKEVLKTKLLASELWISRCVDVRAKEYTPPSSWAKKSARSEVENRLVAVGLEAGAEGEAGY